MWRAIKTISLRVLLIKITLHLHTRSSIVFPLYIDCIMGFIIIIVRSFDSINIYLKRFKELIYCNHRLIIQLKQITKSKKLQDGRYEYRVLKKKMAKLNYNIDTNFNTGRANRNVTNLDLYFSQSKKSFALDANK